MLGLIGLHSWRCGEGVGEIWGHSTLRRGFWPMLAGGSKEERRARLQVVFQERQADLGSIVTCTGHIDPVRQGLIPAHVWPR